MFLPIMINADTLIQALADRTRLRALVLLTREGSLCVCELTAALSVSPPKMWRLRRPGHFTSEVKAWCLSNGRRMGHSPKGFQSSHHAAVAPAAASGSFGRLGVDMFTLRRPRLARAVVTLVIAGAAISSILASAWYYLEDWYFFLILLLLALFGDELLALLLLSGKAENVALTGKEAMIGQIATVVDGFAPAVGLRTVCGKVRLNAELWSAESDCQGCEGLAVGCKVRIRSVEGLTLIVEPEQGSKR